MASREQRWGILGTARIAKKAWKAILNADNAILVGVASRSESKAKNFIDECFKHAPLPHRPAAIGSYQALLDREDVDCVYIPLPTGIRKEWVIRAAEQGKHVLVEKPVGATLQDAEEMAAVCDRQGVLLMDGVMLMHSARTGKIQEALASGELGRLSRIVSHFSFKGDDAFLQGGDIRTSAAAEPLGCLGDLGWYCIRMTLLAMGFQLPIRVRGTVHRQSSTSSSHGSAPPGAGEVPIEFSADMEFESQGTVSATFFCSFCVGASQWVSIACEQGTLYVDDFVLPALGNDSAFTLKRQSLYDEGKCEVVVERIDTQVSTREISHGHPSSQETAMIRTFSEIASRKGTGASYDLDRRRWAQYLLATQKVLNAALDSARRGGAWISL